MNKILKYIAGTSLLLLGVSASQAQEKQPYRLGSAAGILQDIRTQAATLHARLVSAAELKVDAGTVFTGKVNARHTNGKDMEAVIGEIENVPGSSFYLQVKAGEVNGNIILRGSKKGYKYYTDKTGIAYVKEVPLDSLLCINYDKAPDEGTTAARASLTSGGMLNALALPELQSLPGANGVVLLDFDGQYVSGTLWNNGNPINAAPATLTEAQQLEVWELVSEDFRPFRLNVTNSEAVYNTYPANRRMRCIFTPTNTAAPGAGGVAYVGSFNWGNETPCWVFNGGVKGAGDAASHEIGHTFGLGHDGRNTPAEGYYAGHGNWAPIMGVGYYVPVVQWSKGEYTSANQLEDDLAKIASATYGIGYRTDDAGGSIGTAAALNVSGGTVNTNGVIERTGDVDFYSFTTSGGNVSLNFATPTRHPNLDILATLYNSSGGVIATSNPAELSASINTTVGAGTYYISVTGTGYLNPANTGYSNYGSLGSYAITGTIGAVATNVATVYKDCNYGGYAVGLPVGSYTLSQLQARGVLNDDISSLKVSSGYEAILYQHDNFGGDAYLFRGDFSCLVNLTLNGAPLNLNDWTSSIVIRPSSAAAAARTQGVSQYIEKLTTATTQSKLGATLNILPNPFVNEVVVRSTATTKEGFLYVTVFSLDGKTVVPAKRIVNGEKIDLSGASKGVYLIRIENGKDTEIRKIIKQ